MIKFSSNQKARLLVSVCFFSALVPWVFIVFKNIFPIFFNNVNIKYDNSKSLVIFILSVSLIWFIFGFFLPSQLIVSSPQEYSFIDNYTNPQVFIFNTATQVFGLFVFWPVCLYFLFSDNVKRYFSVVFLAISIGILVNVFLFSGNYGLISVNFVYDESPKHSAGEIMFNLCVLLVPFAASFFLYMQKNKNIILVPVSLCVFALLGISVVNIFKINASFNELKTYYVKEQNELQEVSPVFSISRTGKNIVVIMLDRAISVFMPFIFEESPELKETYSGFTYYPNTVSFNGHTRIGSPPIYGGYEYTPEEMNKKKNIPLVEKHNQALLMLPRIFSENGFSVCVSDPPYVNYNQKNDTSIFESLRGVKSYYTDSKYTDLWLSENKLKLSETSEIIKRNMFWYSLLKGLPLLFRQPLYMGGNWCAPIENQRLRFSLDGYAVLDYLNRLTQVTDNNINTALIMTNNTTHESSFLQAPEYVPVKIVTNYGTTRFAKEAAYHINAGSIKRLAVWFNFLKKENVYDNTRIILVSDHGPEPNFITKIGLPINVDQFNPLLMVKDFNASGEIKTNMEFMSNADVPYLSLVNVIENPVNPFTGNEITVKAKEKPLYIAVSGSLHIKDKNGTQFELNPEKDYYIHDSIFDPKNWERAQR
jgi:hypothetical protein